MALFGSNMRDAGTQSSYNTGNLSVSSVSYQTIVTVNNLDAGVYIAHFNVISSTDGGQAPSGDPDSWYMRINDNSGTICDEQYFQEGGINVYQKSGSLTCTFISDGTNDLYFQVRTTDGDGGGVGGRYSAHTFAIMRQS